jgi:hypothetical protein
MVDSAGPAGDPGNTVFTLDSAPGDVGDVVTTVWVSGTLNETLLTTFASEALFLVTDSVGNQAALAPFDVDGYVGSISLPVVSFDVSSAGLLPGPLVIEAYETYDDGPGVDQSWTDLLMFADVGPAPVPCLDAVDRSTPALAEAITVPATVPGLVLDDTTDTYFTFTLPPYGAVAVDMTSTDAAVASWDPDANLRRADTLDNLTFSSEQVDVPGPTDRVVRTYTNPEPTPLAVRLRLDQDHAACLPYDLQLYAADGPDCSQQEPEVSDALNPWPGAPAGPTVLTLGDEDAYAFQVPAGQWVDLTPPEDFHYYGFTRLIVRDPVGGTVLDGRLNSMNTFRNTTNANATYTAIFLPDTTENSPADDPAYCRQFTVAPTFGQHTCSPDGNEPNDSQQTATLLPSSGTLTGLSTGLGDQDWFAIDVPPGERRTISQTGPVTVHWVMDDAGDFVDYRSFGTPTELENPGTVPRRFLLNYRRGAQSCAGYTITVTASTL